jgi:plastocyanin
MKDTGLRLTAATFLLLTFGLFSSHVTPAASQPNDSASKYQVNIDNFSFTPPTLTVPVGAKVTWTNKDDVPHMIVISSKAFARNRI